MMIAAIENRSFKVWEYTVSHGSLLIRSPIDAAYRTNVDLIFTGVCFYSGPTDIGKIQLQEVHPAHAFEKYGIRVPARLSPICIWEVLGEYSNCLIAGAFVNIAEHSEEMFSSPFDYRSAPPRS